MWGISFSRESEISEENNNRNDRPRAAKSRGRVAHAVLLDLFDMRQKESSVALYK